MRTTHRLLVALVALVIGLLVAYGTTIRVDPYVTSASPTSPPVLSTTSMVGLTEINGPATVDPIQGIPHRISPPPPETTLPLVEVAAVPTGLWGLPLAPEGLSDCDEMRFYRLQFGLPERFQALGWRESNCRNEEGVHTFCCYGYWQLYYNLHAKDAQMSPVYAHCEIFSKWDYNGDEPLDKQKMACATAGLYSLNGYSPWAL